MFPCAAIFIAFKVGREGNRGGVGGIVFLRKRERCRKREDFYLHSRLKNFILKITLSFSCCYIRFRCLSREENLC